MSKEIFNVSNSTAVCQSRGSSKLINTTLSLLVLFALFTTSCQKDAVNPASDPGITANSTQATNVAARRDVDAPPLNLRTAIDFTILSETGISTTGTTSITGNIGASPISATAITGFGLTMDATNQFSHTPIVIGKVFASNYAVPTPSNMTTAIADMKTAYTQANLRTFPAPVTEKYAGDISGKILPPGLYKWSTGVLLGSVGVTIKGAPDDVWVFLIAQNLTVGNGALVTLQGGAQAKNIFWVVAGKASIGTGCDFKGNVLSKTLISVKAGSKVHGRLLAQTAVTLIADTVTPY